MSLTFHYSGSFNPNASLSEIIDEVRDIAELHKWKYKVFKSEFPAGGLTKGKYTEDIYGICFTLPK